MNLKKIFGSLIAIFTLCGAEAAEDAQSDWDYSLSPYLWLPTINGSLKYSIPPGAGGSPEISVGPTEWLDLLNYGLLISGSASKGRFSIYSDLVYLSMTSKNDGRVVSVDDSITIPGTRIPIPISADAVLDTRTDLDGSVLMVVAGYDVRNAESSSVILFAGVRNFSVDISSSWNLEAAITLPGGTIVLPSQGHVSGDVSLWDAVAGVRGEFAIGDGKWTMPYYLDAGTGDTELTWNAMVGFSREYGWGDLLIVYRHLYYDQSGDKFLQDFSFGGPVIGARFRF